MAEETDTVLGKHLSAEELLRNKGICHKAWNDWEESSRALPKIGASKQFEPSGSWLENKQIEKGLNSREFLIGIERVERASQLASAEWLPEQKRARVTKRTGGEWANFGHEINTNLYLIPEEALILLETECLELVWEGVPLSIQQAYEVLIESEGSTCTLAEYRVYSQLTRLGYRLQRFHYEKSLIERYAGLEESVPRKKVIVDPENGLWMAGQNAKAGESAVQSKPEVDAEIKDIVESMVVKINGNAEETRNNTSTTATDNNSGEKSTERKTKNPRLEIISEQTILPPIKIVKDGIAEHNVSKWPGARIQRNVKLLPKRNDRLSMPGASSGENSTTTAKYDHERIPDKRKQTRTSADSPETKKSKHEIIELSDDEIEEIPRPMSRMEMLNCLPNISNQLIVTETISKRYIPCGIKPRATYRYDSRKLREFRGSDKPSRAVVESPRSRRDIPWTNQRRAVVPYHQQQQQQQQQHYPRFPPRQSFPLPNYTRPFAQNVERWPMPLMNVQAGGGMCAQQMNRGTGSGGIGWQQHMANNHWSSYRMNFFRNAVTTAYALRGMFMQNHLQMQTHQSLHQRDFANQNFHNRHHGRYVPQRSWRESTPSRASNESTSRSTTSPTRDNRELETYQATFTKIPGTTSWTELKQKWRDAKTITIDSEDSVAYDEDANEIQVIDQTIQPLINAKNFRTFPEAYERLRIIKSAPEKTMRRKKSDLKISYNVYSSTQHYRKANPGMPMFHLVVTSRKDSVFLQPVELNRLQQDGKGAPIIFAHVSNSSIAYLQSGIITLPNLI